jgi:hypothetical protein
MSINLPLKLSFIVLSLFFFAMCAGGKATSQAMDPETLFEKRCTKCHTLDRTYKNETAGYWTTTVQEMKSKLFSGISDEDARTITQYLIDTRTGMFKPENAEKK